jgi:hypothetical protein
MSTITMQKRQKEMKRLEKQRMKRELREQKKLAKRAEREGGGLNTDLVVPTDTDLDPVEPAPEA